MFGFFKKKKANEDEAQALMRDLMDRHGLTPENLSDTASRGQLVIDGMVASVGADVERFLKEVAEPAFFEALADFNAVAKDETVEQVRESIPSFDDSLRKLIAAHEEFAETRLKTTFEAADLVGAGDGVREALTDGLFNLANYVQVQAAEPWGIKRRLLS